MSEEKMDIDESVLFQLSTSLKPHTAGIRDVAVVGDDLIAIAEERCRMNVWERKSATEFERKEGTSLDEKVHTKSAAFCVFAVPPHVKDYPEGSFISGGNDRVARVWTKNGSQIAVLQPHGDNVNSVGFTSDGKVLTGCWDGIVRVWQNSKLVHQFHCHERATEVLGLSSGSIVSASTTGDITIHSADFTLRRHIKQAHEAPVRGVIPHPLGFLTCGNDGFVKVWSSEGDELMLIPAHVGTKKAECYVYGVAVLTGGQIVTCGEDGTVRVFAANGDKIQTIQHPGVVWSVRALANGDFVSGCSDRVARVFSADKRRWASDKDREQFESLVNLAAATRMQELDVHSLPTQDALSQPGNQDGAIKLIREGEKAFVYKWDTVKQAWEKFGEAMGRAQKEVVNGQEWDVVTDVYVSDNLKYPLCFNKDEDPMDIAQRFITQHNLPPYTLEQIVEHVAPLVDQEAVLRKKQVQKVEAEKVALVQIPCWRTGSFHLFSNVKPVPMRKAILKANAEMLEENAAAALSDDDMKAFDTLMETIQDNDRYHSAVFTSPESKVLAKLLRWPTSKIVPVLDAYRVLMLHQDAVKHIGGSSNAVYRDYLSRHATESLKAGSHNVAMLILRAAANWTAKRIRTADERKHPPAIPEAVLKFTSQVLDELSDAVSIEKDSVLFSYIMFCHNVALWLGRINAVECELYTQIISGLFECLEHIDTMKPKTLFFALLTLGSIAYVSPESKTLIQAAFSDQLAAIVQKCSGSKVQPVKEVLQDFEKVFGKVDV